MKRAFTRPGRNINRSKHILAMNITVPPTQDGLLQVQDEISQVKQIQEGNQKNTLYFTFSNEDDAEQVMQQYHNQQVFNRKLILKYVVEKQPPTVYGWLEEKYIQNIIDFVDSQDQGTFIKGKPWDNNFKPITDEFSKYDSDISLMNEAEILKIPCNKNVEQFLIPHRFFGPTAYLIPISSESDPTSVGCNLVLKQRQVGNEIQKNIVTKGLVKLYGDIRYNHYIRFDKVDHDVTILLLRQRYEIPLKKECHCGYDQTTMCDTLYYKQKEKLEDLSADELEEKFVHQVYNAIATHWHHTRQHPWKTSKEFLESLPDGTTVADIGCGNGRNMLINQKLNMVGCDISEELIKICQQRGLKNTMVGNAKNIPYADNSYEVAISVAVLHHFASEENRIKALQELVRIVKPGGHIFVCAWALEQDETCYKNRSFESSEVFVAWTLQNKFSQNNENEIFQRYCYLFSEGELNHLVNKYCKGVTIEKTIYDSANWVLIMKKDE